MSSSLPGIQKGKNVSRSTCMSYFLVSCVCKYLCVFVCVEVHCLAIPPLSLSTHTKNHPSNSLFSFPSPHTHHSTSHYTPHVTLSHSNALIAGSKDGTVWMWLSHNGQCGKPCIIYSLSIVLILLLL
jgi:hypothetical protein